MAAKEQNTQQTQDRIKKNAQEALARVRAEAKKKPKSSTKK
jgi:hypothetical protein